MAVNLHATHFRFGIDELAESTHGWHAALDTNPAQGVIAVDTPFLLRVTIQETGGTAASNTDTQFQCRKNAGAFQNITTSSTIVKAVAAVALTNGGNCTKRLTGTGTFETTGAGQTEDGLSGGTANDIAASGNSETECGLQIVGADVAGNDVIEFRWTSPDFTITNDVVPAITIAGATIVEADGAASGVATSAVDGRAIWAGVTSAAGVAASAVVSVAIIASLANASALATDAIIGAAVAAAEGVSAGLASGEYISGAIAGADGVSNGVGTALGTATNTEAADGNSAGIAEGTGIGAAIALAVADSTGAATTSGLAAIILAGVGESIVGGGGAGGAGIVIINE